MIKNQTDTFISDLSFGHNLCYKYSNGSCEPILDIYVLRTFQWYKEVFNLMGLTFQIVIWRFRNPSGFQFPKWKSTWECVGSFLHTFPHSWECDCDSLLALSTHTFPCPCFGREPKAKVVTHVIHIVYNETKNLWLCGIEMCWSSPYTSWPWNWTVREKKIISQKWQIFNGKTHFTLKWCFFSNCIFFFFTK
jgi:hypothetical protein